jgi:integrase
MSAKMTKTRTPGVYKRGDRYVVVWRHKGRQHKAFFRTYEQAREAKAQRQAGDRSPTTKAMFEDYAREWVDGYAGRTSRGFTETSREGYKAALENYAIPFFEGWKLADIEPPDVRRFVRHLEGGDLAPASVVKNLVPLKALFATAVEDQALRFNPTTGVRVNRRRDDTPDEDHAKAMTRSELGRVLSEIPAERRLFFDLLATTGVRISEAAGLNWGDLKLGTRPMLLVRRQWYRGKLKALKTTSGRREIPLSPSIARALWAVGAAKPGDEPMFTTATGTRISDGNLRTRVLAKATERAGVDWVTFHTFRHTCASMLFDSGKSIKQVQVWLGHSDAAFTLRTYVHLMDDGLGDADCLDEQLTRALAEGNERATQDPETAANDGTAEAV